MNMNKELKRISKDLELEQVSTEDLLFLQEHQQAVLNYGDIRLAEASGISEAEWNRDSLLTDDEAVCAWCGEIIDKSDLSETKLGLVCDTCIRAIESRGETV
jgi:hypothetical protein